jgi:hypothetical protein
MMTFKKKVFASLILGALSLFVQANQHCRTNPMSNNDICYEAVSDQDMDMTASKDLVFQNKIVTLNRPWHGDNFELIDSELILKPGASVSASDIRLVNTDIVAPSDAIIAPMGAVDIGDSLLYASGSIELAYNDWKKVQEYNHEMTFSQNLNNHIRKINKHYFSRLEAEALSYSEAVERIEWAYKCGHLRNQDDLPPYLIKRNLLNQDHRFGQEVIKYPSFKNKNGYFFAPTVREAWCHKFNDHQINGYFFAPTVREARCDKVNDHQIIEFKHSKPGKQCEMTRLEAYLDQYITEAEYLDMVHRGRAPVEVYSGAEVPCL